MISVLNYGLGNLGSVMNMLNKIGASVQLIDSETDLLKAEKILLPGVGAFDHGMSMLAERGWVEILQTKVKKEGVPIFGICLGMQLLGLDSEEGQKPGLGLIQAHCRKFKFPEYSRTKIPHMGWNLIHPNCEPGSHPLLHGLDNQSRFYFVHSYHMHCTNREDSLATTTYDQIEFDSMIQHGNVMGAQFHPEKSHRFGMRLLKNFSEL